jgi:hypothetical protein
MIEELAICYETVDSTETGFLQKVSSCGAGKFLWWRCNEWLNAEWNLRTQKGSFLPELLSNASKKK